MQGSRSQPNVFKTCVVDYPIDTFVGRMLEGNLTREEVFADGGHGAVILNGTQHRPPVVATGPRQQLMMNSGLEVHLSSPHGDTMMTGCYGLISACGMRVQAWREEIEKALGVRLPPSD